MVADTVYAPRVALAVKVGAVALPEPSLITIAVVLPPVKVPLAPEAGAVKVTATLETGLLLASSTVACSAVGKLPPATVSWGVPALAAMDAGDPARLVSEKLAGVATPATVAVTV